MATLFAQASFNLPLQYNFSPLKSFHMEIEMEREAPITEACNMIKLPLNISQEFMAGILKPYKPHTTYLKSARILQYQDPAAAQASKDLVTIEGTFSIPDSCYIDNTGHFNAVEFNICYNQLAYVLFGSCIKTGILQKLVPYWDEKVNMSFESFVRNQLSSMLIVKIEGNFIKPIDSDHFFATLTISRIIWAGETPFVHTKISFSDDSDGRSFGTVLLAFNKETAQ